jgi:hypothetical protein
MTGCYELQVAVSIPDVTRTNSGNTYEGGLCYLFFMKSF